MYLVYVPTITSHCAVLLAVLQDFRLLPPCISGLQYSGMLHSVLSVVFFLLFLKRFPYVITPAQTVHCAWDRSYSAIKFSQHWNCVCVAAEEALVRLLY